jgi:rhamnose transport system substrate-binding protein
VAIIFDCLGFATGENKLKPTKIILGGDSMKKSFRMKSMSVLLAICVMLSLLLVGCGGSTPATQSSKVTPTKKIVVRYICLVKGIPYFDPIIAGMKTAVEAAGATFQETAADKSDATAQIPLIEAAVQDKVDVICISPSSATALNATLDAARAKGVKILMVNDDIYGSETHRDGAILSCNYDQLANDSFEAFAKNMNYTGNFVVVSSKTDTPFQNHQIEIYKKMMTDDTKYKNMKLLEVLYGNVDATKSLTVTQAAIQKYPNLNGIMSPTTVGIIAVAQAVANAGLAKKIVVFGLGTPTQCKSFIQDGTLSGAMLWDTNRTGQVAGIVAVGLAKGIITLTAATSFTAGTFGKTDILANNIIYSGPPLEFTKDNVNNYNF